jgi:hypothetical protein
MQAHPESHPTEWAAWKQAIVDSFIMNVANFDWTDELAAPGER